VQEVYWFGYCTSINRYRLMRNQLHNRVATIVTLFHRARLVYSNEIMWWWTNIP